MNISPALEFKRRQRAKQAAEAAEQQASTQAAAAAPIPDPAPPTPTGVPSLDHQQRARYEEARERIAALREQRHEEQLQQVREEQDDFEQLLQDLAADEDRFRQLPRGEARTAMQRDEILPKWRPIVQAYMESGDAYPNPIAVKILIWLFNVADYATAIPLADLLLAQNQRMPQNFKRGLPVFVADSIREIVEDLHAREQDIPADLIDRGHTIASDPAQPDDVRIKWHKLIGDIHAAELPTRALEAYQSAHEIDPKKAQVKTRIRDTKRAIKKLSE